MKYTNWDSSENQSVQCTYTVHSRIFTSMRAGDDHVATERPDQIRYKGNYLYLSLPALMFSMQKKIENKQTRKYLKFV